MKKRMMLLLASASILAAVVASATTTTQSWVLGWDNFEEPLNLTKSNVKWSVSSSRKITVKFGLAGARPNKLYRVGINFFCSTFPATFGQFPTDGGGATASHSRDKA